MKKNYFLLIASVLFSFTTVFSQQLTPEQLQKGRWLSQAEYDKRAETGKYFEPTDAPDGPVHAVAEFESMQAVLIAYPFGIPMSLIVEMAEDVMLTTIVASSGQANSVSSQYESAGVNMDHVNFLIEPHDTYWTRDYGPWFIREEDKISIINFTYNRPRPDDDIMPVNVANMLNIDYYNMPVIHTGGNYMCDGFGIAAQTQLVYQENSISDAQVDQYMEDYLGVIDNYVINDPLDDYIMHIDCWGKFLDVDKVLVAEVPESDYRYEDYEAAANYFASRNCAYGYPFEVVRVFGPGDYPYTPYTNSLILNKKVFLPITGSTHDAAAIATYEEAMPGYEIIPVTAGSNGWLNSDALHCRTHEIADVGMLRITHIPAYHGEVEYAANYTIEANIHAYSNENLYPDSLLVYYKINDGDYASIVMTNTEDETYSAQIQANPGDEVAYYIHAADESGRSENNPYIGAPDPFVFSVVAGGDYLSLTPDTINLLENYEPRLVVKNIGSNAIDILNITPEQNYIGGWVIDRTNPENINYPYSITPGDSVEVFLTSILSKSIFYDSLLVITNDSTYHSIIMGESVGIDDKELKDAGLSFMPNPMNHQGNISFELNQAAAVQLSIFNLQGQMVNTLENSRLPNGSYKYYWDGKNYNGNPVDGGVYLIQLRIDNRIISKKFLKM